ncbi:SIR2 family protein [Rhodococcus sp. T2V]|nr:SIR2 family protein [Rhodococcus sp. T2V]MDF3311663.1 SIR2 family protein [Rhodococcus sp. T2V]
MRALVVIAAPSDLNEYDAPGRLLAPIDVDAELQWAREKLEPFHPVVLVSDGEATLAKITQRLDGRDRFDILLLTCHGAITDDVPLLFLEKADGTTDVVDARRVEETFRDLAHRPSLVFLNSCQSAGVADSRHSADGGALSAIGPRLAAAGVPAVVAMQANVTMQTASNFARALFESFAADPVIDRAVAVARDQVRDRGDWWVPVLYSRIRSGRFFVPPPSFGDDSEDPWEYLDLMLRNGKVTPVLGPGLADGILGSRSEVAQRWARRWQMPLSTHTRDDLAQVTQYMKVRLGNRDQVPIEVQDYIRTYLQERKDEARGDDPFMSVSQDILDNEPPQRAILEVGKTLRHRGNDPYSLVAAIPAEVYITTAWTDLLQDALKDRGKDPTTLCFPWYSKFDWTDEPWGKSTSAEPPSTTHPWVYHLFGRLEEPKTLVLTHDDYFDWLSNWIVKKDLTAFVPPRVKRALTDKSLLFLGYRLDDWDFRVVFQGIKAFGMDYRDGKHIGVQLRPESEAIDRHAAQRYLESYFGRDNHVNIFWANTTTFLNELRQQTGLQ